jgi:predicted transcriptional regulator
MAEQSSAKKDADGQLLRMTADVVAAYVKHNSITSTQLPAFIGSVYASLRALDTSRSAPLERALRPAIPVRKSITPDYLICLEDGKKLKMLKRHLRSTYNLTPDEYRAKWGLPPDYPMVAPNYAEQRSAFAKRIGLGRSRAGRRSGQAAKK